MSLRWPRFRFAQGRLLALVPVLCMAALVSACKSTAPAVVTPPPPAGNAPLQVEPVDPAVQAKRRAQLRLQLALGYFEQGQNQVALEEIGNALAADPSLGAAYNLRGLVYMRLDDPAQAEDSFRRAVALNPRDGDALHNYGWLMCQQKRYADAVQRFGAALAVPGYRDAARTWMTQGVCQMQAGDSAGAQRSLMQAYELDSANPVVGYNLALLLYQRRDDVRAQFYIRRVNNGPSANAESLWLGMRIERRLGNAEAVSQLGMQLRRRFPDARETLAYERGNFND
ncbi:type IV pilus biogenesis/stability protein PilW [uncultured Pseudacidovorax sp.]|uniref:type IV pilus biogenesis/stability protein PilW n=1 Tax=uncultured Pseudacidovorax sp. TaxID=679313 RepID=UPI0025FC35F0|nr:type IV pilus biogenesis/stability protein PilW [uncultured Pseudacidovorax sp.]